ncbi:universal stress protein [Roseovarius arcticus]|uniref:universal stress protein n=1 Tax=Roseovarius arcticus TaxID=2547404 RepID=UPI001110CA14|nr:universal stress protein [Roseovarius arcticus]
MYRTILLAYDGTIEGRLALREGARLAQICGARLVLLAVVEPVPDHFYGGEGAVYIPPDKTDDIQKILDEGLERLARMGLSAEARLETGRPAEWIAVVAQETMADLVVVGHHKLGVLERWLRGSVTKLLSDNLTCSLLVARLEISDDDLFKATAAVSPDQ